MCELCVWPKIMGENTMFKVSAQIDTVNLTLSLRLLNGKAVYSVLVCSWHFICVHKIPEAIKF